MNRLFAMLTFVETGVLTRFPMISSAGLEPSVPSGNRPQQTGPSLLFVIVTFWPDASSIVPLPWSGHALQIWRFVSVMWSG